LNEAVREGMDRRRFEIATIGTARALRSTYCTAAHSLFLRDVCEDETAMIAIAADPSDASLSDQDRAAYAFSAKVASDSASIQEGSPTPTSRTWSSRPPHGPSSPASWMVSVPSSTSRPRRRSHQTS